MIIVYILEILSVPSGSLLSQQVSNNTNIFTVRIINVLKFNYVNTRLFIYAMGTVGR